MKEMILFRTHRSSPFIRRQFDILAATSGRAVVPVFDRTHGAAGFEDVETLDVDADRYRAMGLRADDDFGWRCGDYGFYAARLAYPDVDRFWMIEFDVLLSFRSTADFFDGFAAADGVDLLTAGLRPAADDWFWSNAAKAWFGTAVPWRCFFPTNRVSARLIDHLLAERRRMSAAPRDDGTPWPNDESFVATGAATGGFRTADLNAFGTTYRSRFYRHEWPMRVEPLRGRDLGLLLHPVLDETELSAKPHRFAAEPPVARTKRRIKRALWDAQLRTMRPGRRAGATAPAAGSVRPVIFVTEADPLDIRAYSGTPSFMFQALKRLIPAIEPVSHPRPRWMVQLRRAGLKLSGQRLDIGHWPIFNRIAMRRIARRHPGAVAVMPVASGLAAQLGRSNPVVYLSDTVFSLLRQLYPGTARQAAVQGGWMERGERDAIRFARHCSFSSTWAADEAVRHYGKDAVNVSMVSWGCNLDWIAPRSDTPATDRCNLLFIAVDWQRKGGDLVLAIARVLNDRRFRFHLDLVGVAPPAETAIPANVTVHGRLNKDVAEQGERLRALLGQASFLLLPTRADCTPMVFAEAHAYGAPAITTDVGGVSSVVERGRNGFALPLDAGAADYADVIMASFADRDGYAALRAGARAAYDDRLNWSVWAARIAERVEAIRIT